MLDRLTEANYILMLDLKMAFYQIPLEEKSKEITAFPVPGRGHFHYTRMPFCLTNSPATFQRLIYRIISADLEHYAFPYLDDIAIVSKTFEDHIKWLTLDLERERE